MIYRIIVCIALLLSCGVLGAVQLPPGITRCAKSDSKCMRKSIIHVLQLFKNGNKEFGIPPLEPFQVEKIEITPDPSKSVQLNQKYEDVYMYGMTDAELKEFSIKEDGKTSRWEMLVYTKGTRMEAEYSLTGQILVFPINGHGRCNVTLKGITGKHMADCEHYTKKGKSYLKLSNYKMDLSVENCYFDFPNIIPGNEQISKEVGKTVNENSVEIFQDVKGGFEQLIGQLYQNGANSVFSKIPEDELFLT